MTKVKSIRTTVRHLIDSFLYGPDCTIERVFPNAAAELAEQVGTGYLVSAINGQQISDSGELKETLLRAAPGEGYVTADFIPNNVSDDRININESVRFNGGTSAVLQPKKEELDEMLETISSNSAEAQVAPQDDNRSAQDVRRASGQSADAAVPPDDSQALDHSSLGSESSFSDFNTVQIDELGRSHRGESGSSSRPSEAEHAPELLQFDKMQLSMRGELPPELLTPECAARGGDVAEVTMKSRLLRALRKVQLGRCVICVTQDINPIAEVELLAMNMQRRVVALDLSVKLRHRPKPPAVAAAFQEAMRTGAWFIVVNAHKSINTCTLLEELLKESQEHDLEGFDPEARIIISLEPHPHFPKRLVEGAVVIKLVLNFQGSSILSDSLATSRSRHRLVTADTLEASQHPERVPQRATPVATVQKPTRRTVRINAAVDVVDIAPREVVKVSRRDCPIDVSGSVALQKTFSGIANDKFLCVSTAGESGRFAVGSSFGNVYFLDGLGNSLLQVHSHGSSIWDLSFADKLSFATGCEDGMAATWRLAANSVNVTNDALLVPTSATTLGSDVYCVSFLKNINPSPLLIGGLCANLVVRAADSEAVQFLPVPSNAQVIDCLPSSSTALVGGGDGSVSVIDVARAKTLRVMTEHTRKVPALTVRDDNHFFTGSFDSSILSCDLRVPGGKTAAAGSDSGGDVSTRTLNTLRLRNYVTGLDVDDVHLAASVGENLYLWDVRKLNVVLGGYAQGWRGLSRGVKVQSAEHLIVTASPDGYVRFWNFA